MTTGTTEGIFSTPRTRYVTVSERGLEIQAVHRGKEHEKSTWLVTPVELPDCKPGTFKVHFAIALEWSVDVLVEYKPKRKPNRVELWRVGPWGLRTRTQLIDDKGDAVEGFTSLDPEVPVGIWGGRVVGGARPWTFSFVHRGSRVVKTYDVRTDALRFVAETKRVRNVELKWDVFISYKDQDAREFAELVHDLLLQYRLSVWFAPMMADGYTDFAAEVSDGLKRSTLFLIILSEHSLDKPPDRAHGEERGSESRLVQRTEIETILDHYETKARVLCALNLDERALKEYERKQELLDNRLHVHRPGKRDQDDYASDIAELVRNCVRSSGKAGKG